MMNQMKMSFGNPGPVLAMVNGVFFLKFYSSFIDFSRPLCHMW